MDGASGRRVPEVNDVAQFANRSESCAASFGRSGIAQRNRLSVADPSRLILVPSRRTGAATADNRELIQALTAALTRAEASQEYPASR